MEETTPERLRLIEEKRRRLAKLEQRDWTAEEIRRFRARVVRLTREIEELDRLQRT